MKWRTHSVEFACRVLDCGALEAGDVAARGRLGDAEADPLVAPEAVGRDLVLEELGAKEKHGRKADGKATHDAPHDSTAAAPGELVDHDELVEGVEVGGAGADVLGGPLASAGSREDLSLVALPQEVVRELLLVVPLLAVRHDLGLAESPDLGAPGVVGLGVVGAVVAAVPGGVAEGNLLERERPRERERRQHRFVCEKN